MPATEMLCREGHEDNPPAVTKRDRRVVDGCTGDSGTRNIKISIVRKQWRGWRGGLVLRSTGCPLLASSGLFWPLPALGIHMVHMHTCRQNNHAHVFF